MARLAGCLGLCRRAGKAFIGADLCAEAIKKGKTRLVILASDVAPNTEKKIAAVAAHHSVRVAKGDLTREELAHAVGKTGPVGAVAVSEEFFELVTTSLKAE